MAAAAQAEEGEPERSSGRKEHEFHDVAVPGDELLLLSDSNLRVRPLLGAFKRIHGRFVRNYQRHSR